MGSASAQEQVDNLYFARNYQTDEALYANFIKATGIKIDRVNADDAGILARLKAEGVASPADVILLVDASRLVEGDSEGLFLLIKQSPLKPLFLSLYAPKPRQTAQPGLVFQLESACWFMTKPV